MIVYRPQDRVAVKIGELVIKVAPLMYMEKTHLLTSQRMSKGTEKIDSVEVQFRTLQTAIKAVENFPEAHFPDGTKVELQWVEGKLTDESMEILVQVIGYGKASVLSSTVVIGNYNQDLEGIVFEPVKNEPEKKVQLS